MRRLDTKLEQNVYYQARKRASAYDERFNSRDYVSECLGFETRTSLTSWELGNKIPSPENVNLLADLYKAPELRNHYCKHMCPLGCDWPAIDPGAIDSLDRITVSALHTLEGTNSIKLKLLEIAADGKITAEEYETMMIVINALKDLEIVSQELQTWFKNHK